MISDLEARLLAKRKWETAEGRRLSWEQMDISHLHNAAAFLWRSSAEYISRLYDTLSWVHSDNAADALESAITHAEDRQVDANDLADDMEAYADYRINQMSQGVKSLPW